MLTRFLDWVIGPRCWICRERIGRSSAAIAAHFYVEHGDEA